MGLGLFIAKTLLERSGAEMSFANGSDAAAGIGQRGARSGAIIEARWTREKLGADTEGGRAPLGQNMPIGPDLSEIGS